MKMLNNVGWRNHFRGYLEGWKRVLSCRLLKEDGLYCWYYSLKITFPFEDIDELTVENSLIMETLRFSVIQSAKQFSIPQGNLSFHIFSQLKT